MKFSKPTLCFDRNGAFPVSGLEVRLYENNSVIVLEPTTAHGKVGRADIEIPIEDVPLLIAELRLQLHRSVKSSDVFDTVFES